MIAGVLLPTCMMGYGSIRRPPILSRHVRNDLIGKVAIYAGSYIGQKTD